MQSMHFSYVLALRCDVSDIIAQRRSDLASMRSIDKHLTTRHKSYSEAIFSCSKTRQSITSHQYLLAQHSRIPWRQLETPVKQSKVEVLGHPWLNYFPHIVLAQTIRPRRFRFAFPLSLVIPPTALIMSKQMLDNTARRFSFGKGGAGNPS